MLEFFIPIAEALLAGYITAIVVYMAVMFAITRLPQRTLIQHDKARWSYTVLHAITWCFAALAGGYLCCRMAPLPPYGLLGFPLVLAAILAVMLLRGFFQLPGHMSPLALSINLVAILGGTMLALASNSVFTLLTHLG